jgi:hypothetical protein
MAKIRETRVVGLRASTLAMYSGTFWGVIGLGVAVLYSLRNTVNYAQETQSVLTGLAFGIVTGIVSIIVLPFLYFALGWVVGYVQGWIFNVIAKESGGIMFRVED